MEHLIISKLFKAIKTVNTIIIDIFSSYDPRIWIN